MPSFNYSKSNPDDFFFGVCTLEDENGLAIGTDVTIVPKVFWDTYRWLDEDCPPLNFLPEDYLPMGIATWEVLGKSPEDVAAQLASIGLLDITFEEDFQDAFQEWKGLAPAGDFTSLTVDQKGSYVVVMKGPFKGTLGIYVDDIQGTLQEGMALRWWANIRVVGETFEGSSTLDLEAYHSRDTIPAPHEWCRLATYPERPDSLNLPETDPRKLN